MRLILCSLIAALTLSAATITITVRNDAGTIISTSVMQTDMATLKAFNDWRQAQVTAPAVLTYPTVDALWKHIIGSFIRDNVLEDWLPSIIEQRRLKDVAESERKRLLEAAVQ